MPIKLASPHDGALATGIQELQRRADDYANIKGGPEDSQHQAYDDLREEASLIERLWDDAEIIARQHGLPTDLISDFRKDLKQLGYDIIAVAISVHDDEVYRGEQVEARRHEVRKIAAALPERREELIHRAREIDQQLQPVPEESRTGGEPRPPDDAKSASWSPPAGYVGTSEICSDPRFQKNEKSPPRTTVQKWEERSHAQADQSKHVKVEYAPGTGESYYPEDWVIEQRKRWNPRKA